MPRKPTRADGIATYEKLLNEIDSIFGNGDRASLSLKDVAESAGVPVASAYHFFPSPEAALAALTERYIELAAIELMSNHAADTSLNWQGVVNDIFCRARDFYQKYPSAQKLRLRSHNSESARYLLLESNWALAEVISLELDRLFDVPNQVSLIEDLALAITLADALWALSVTIHGTVTDRYALEAERAVTAFLLPILGSRLPLKAQLGDE